MVNTNLVKQTGLKKYKLINMSEVTELTDLKWYIVRTQSSREKSISDKIKNESEKGDLLGKVNNIIVPIENTFYLKGGKKVKREKVLYPGYVFIETNAIGELKYFLRGVNGASGFLTDRQGKIQELSKKDVTRMIGIQEELAIEKETKFLVDEVVKIIEGPFSSMIGTIEKIDGDKVRVNVAIFGRVTPVDLTTSQIDKN
jgi:transcription termination/antitermination protein NusG